MVLGCVFVGSLSCDHTEIERRPYHSNCSCALHKLKRNVGAAACSLHKNVSFTKKQPWNLCSLHVNVIASHEDFSSQSSLLDPSSSIGNVQDSKEIITFN
ncbi:hypothetical protein Pint_14699 [Pistacia integerrima]|uniref:Uncharacterized protein n=1 Tax=Pistacia integerrima TaxID=434235 RepID=A0ACC0Y3B6_9ROSI|nr:hypothetical protein Pint_14699 [Pistacia integerrima]